MALLSPRPLWAMMASVRQNKNEAAEPPPSPAKMAASTTTVSEDCALFFGNRGPLIASGDKIGIKTKIKARLVAKQAPDSDPWIGIILDFPLGKDQKDNEKSGFGVRYRAPEHASETSKPSDYHQVRLKFPRGFEFALENGEARSKLTDEHLCYIKVFFGQAKPTIEGFGLPFANRKDPKVEAWVNKNAPMAGEYTLLDILNQENLYLVMKSTSSLVKLLCTTYITPPFAYPYSNDMSWDYVWSEKNGAWDSEKRPRAEKEIQKNKGHQFAPIYSHSTDVSHLTAVYQSAVQDVLWLHNAAERIKKVWLPAYFFRCKVPDTGVKQGLHVVIPFPEQLMNTVWPSWNLLIKQRIFKLYVHSSPGSGRSTEGSMACHLAPLGRLERYARHRNNSSDLILVVERETSRDYTDFPFWHDDIDLDKLKMFTDRQSAKQALDMGEENWNHVSLLFDVKIDQCEYRSEAVSLFDPHAYPSNAIAYGLPRERKQELLDDMTRQEQRILDEVKDRMDLHRAVVRGAGFYDWMTKAGSNGKWRQLPTANFLNVDDQIYVSAILETVLPKDRARLRSYLSNRPLGISIITGGPGFGKTTTGATVTLCMQEKLGKILCSGPTHCAVDNFAHHLDKKTRDITERLNAGKPPEDSTRHHRKLVVRPYSYREESRAFCRLLKNPKLGDKALDDWDSVEESEGPANWQFHLSVAYWLLLLFRSPAVDRSLEPDDSPALHKIQQDLDDDEQLWAIRERIGRPSDQFYMDDFDDHFRDLLETLIDGADLLCISQCTVDYPGGYGNFRSLMNVVRGISIDQAGSMNRPDLYSIWGNTLIPCCLIGDPEVERPIVQTVNEKELDSENYYNRFAKDGQISALGFLQASGLPVFRLETQVRMAEGMCDLAHKVFYPNLLIQQRKDFVVEDRQPDLGRELEAYARMRYPELRKPPEGILKQPFFVHRPGSTIYKDVDGTQACQEQDSSALSFLVGLVTHSIVDPARIVILTPWVANAALIERKRSGRNYQLIKDIPKTTTVEMFQGKEADIVVIVMGTTRETGPRVTTDEQLLKTMLTRHKSGLVIFGDICTSGVIGENHNGNLFKINKQGRELTALQKIDEKLFDDGRVVVMKKGGPGRKRSDSN